MQATLQHPVPHAAPVPGAPFFVMLWGDRARTFLVPLKHIDGDVILFDSGEEARKAALETVAGAAYGFGVFGMSGGFEGGKA